MQRGHRNLREAKSQLSDPAFANRGNSTPRGDVGNESIASFEYAPCRLSIRQKVKSRKQSLR